eukprot:2228653-Pyramimonas_sp.AAC.1
MQTPRAWCPSPGHGRNERAAATGKVPVQNDESRSICPQPQHAIDTDSARRGVRGADTMRT